MCSKHLRFELREALKAKKKILLLHESDVRHQPFDFVAGMQQAPEDLQMVRRRALSKRMMEAFRKDSTVTSTGQGKCVFPAFRERARQDRSVRRL